MTNPWIEHVKAYARDHNISYACAITEAIASYDKNIGIEAKNVKERNRSLRKEEQIGRRINRILDKRDTFIGKVKKAREEGLPPKEIKKLEKMVTIHENMAKADLKKLEAVEKINQKYRTPPPEPEKKKKIKKVNKTN